MGVVPVEPARTHRRIDVKVYAPEELPFALLYFTGSGYFNRSMRYWAKRRFGLSLNDKGIFRETSNAASKVTDAEIDDEADVFEYLRLKYVAPEDRSV
jgi:DNA polymerase/3'-5' exonuclease PolX